MVDANRLSEITPPLMSISGIVATALLAVPGSHSPLSLPIEPSFHFCSPGTTSDIRFNPFVDDNKMSVEYVPKTDFGRKLMSIRRAYIEGGGKILNEQEFEAELRVRRGGISG